MQRARLGSEPAERIREAHFPSRRGVESYPEPEGLALQEEAMRAWGEAAPSLAEAGVEAFIHRSYWDTPGTGGYFQAAEQHWGLAWWENGTAKPALDEWTELGGEALPSSG
jgi:hypothetical protein